MALPEGLKLCDFMLKKVIYKAILIVTALVLLLGLVLQLIAKTIVTDFLDRNIPDHIHLEYGGLNANVLTGSIGLEAVSVEWSNRDTIGIYGILKMDALNLDGLGYFNFLFNNTLSVDHIEFVRPRMSYAPYSHFSKKDTIDNTGTGLKRTLAVSRFNIVEGEFIQLQEGRDSIKFQVKKLDLYVKDLQTNDELIKNKIPVTYGGYAISTGQVRLDLGPFEVLAFNDVAISEGNMQLNGLSLVSKYTKKGLSKLLKHERDHIDLKIPEISLSGLGFGFNGDRFFLNVESGSLNGPDLEIYRDKLITDDLKKKKLYGQLLRELPFDMDMAALTIKKGRIAYAELVEEGVIPGEISFTQVDADLKSISNIQGEGKGTEIEIRARLMGEAPLLLNWNFDPKKKNDAFFVSGRVSHFRAESINPFLKSNLRVETKGEVKELYFTISGDAVSSNGEMKMHYGDFSFAVLKKDRISVNKLLTAIGNVFINDGSKTDGEGYRHGKIHAERDATKSFFNYLWNNVKAGILSTLTGDGRE